jgi:hypothetical protein
MTKIRIVAPTLPMSLHKAHRAIPSHSDLALAAFLQKAFENA